MDQNYRVQKSEKISDITSRAQFISVPIGFYQIEVQGNEHY